MDKEGGYGLFLDMQQAKHSLFVPTGQDDISLLTPHCAEIVRPVPADL